MRNRTTLAFPSIVLALIAAIALTVALSASVFAGGRPLSADLTGVAEIPDADPDGTGHVDLWLNAGQEEICFELTASGIAPAFAAHIHIGFSDLNGPVVVGLAAPTGGSASGCVTLAREKIQAILQAPHAFYVNVHNADFPGGAIRGQLG